MLVEEEIFNWENVPTWAFFLCNWFLIIYFAWQTSLGWHPFCSQSSSIAIPNYDCRSLSSHIMCYHYLLRSIQLHPRAAHNHFSWHRNRKDALSAHRTVNRIMRNVSMRSHGKSAKSGICNNNNDMSALCTLHEKRRTRRDVDHRDGDRFSSITACLNGE